MRTLHAERVLSPNGSGQVWLQLVVDGQPVGQPIPPEMATMFADVLRQQARNIINDRDPERLAKEQAILLRAGLTVGLTNDPAIQKEALVLAAHDRDLRRYMPTPGGSVRAVTGKPTIIRGPRRDVH